jgi:trans-aconitate methyltransferase
MKPGEDRPRDVWRLYDDHAAAFDRARGRNLMEEPYLRRVLERLPGGRGSILDIGCGAGDPVARFFLDAGCEVTGIDAAPAMLALARSRFPDATWIESDMRTLALPRRFDALIAWDSFFHLDADTQRRMFPIFHAHAAPRAVLLFTSGPGAGEAIGDFCGEPLYHASLDAAEYRALLAANGFDVLMHRVEDPDCGGHTVWLAQSRE